MNTTGHTKLSEIPFYLFLLYVVFTTTVAAQVPAQSLLKIVDFETGDLTGLAMQKAQEDSVTLVTSPVRFGKFAAKTLLRATDPKVNNGQRAEFSDSKSGRGTLIEMNKAYWYGLSIYVPDDFQPPAKSDAVLFQWHTQQGGPSPVLAIRVKGNMWLITADVSGNRRVLARLPLIKNKWTDWVVHARWSAEKDGYWIIWKDGTEIVNEKNVVTQYAEALGPYVKFGQYHSVEEAPQNVVYFDEFRVADDSGRYEMVAPPR